MEFTETNMDKIQCGTIFLSLDNFTYRGEIMLNCSFCEEKLNFSFQEYKNHLLAEHYPEIEFESCLIDRMCQTMEDEEMFENREENASVSKNEFMDFLQMDLNKCDDSFFSIQKLMETSDESSMNDVPIQETRNKSKANVKTNLKIDKNKKCLLCDRKFFLSSSLNNHLERHRNADDAPGFYKCNLCNSSFDLKFSLTLHHIGEHRMSQNHQNKVQAVGTTSRKSSPTNLCKKPNFSKRITASKAERISASNISVAATKIGNITDPPNISESGETYKIPNTTSEPNEFHCKICNKQFCEQSRFNAHMNRHKPCEFKCSTCSKEFKTAGELQTHTRFHTGERPYLCANCGETFATVSKLINHTRRHHTFERTKECPICKRKFYAAGELKVHLQSTHSNERPYKCQTCPATFNRPFSLRTHMKSHENKREHKCNFCPASFNQKCNLTAHKKKAHCLVTVEDKRE